MRGNSLGSNSSGKFPQEAILQRITPLEELVASILMLQSLNLADRVTQLAF